MRKKPMPKFSRLSDEQVDEIRSRRERKGSSQREKVRKQYVEYLNQFKPGDWISVSLEDGDNRTTVRNRLMRAAKDLGWKLNFVRTRGSLRFEIIAEL